MRSTAVSAKRPTTSNGGMELMINRRQKCYPKAVYKVFLMKVVALNAHP